MFPDWAEVAVRTLVAVTVLFVITKVLGKRQVTQLSLFEYITGITIGNLAASISLDADKPWYIGMVSLTVWVSVSLLIMHLQIRSKTVRDIIDGKSTILIQDGEIIEKNLRKEKLALDELLAQLRKKNIFRIADVEYASIEPNGALSVLLKQPYRPVTADMLGIEVESEKEPQNIVMDGAILDEALYKSGLTKESLKQEFDQRGVKLEEVFLAQVDAKGELHIDLHNDKVAGKEETVNEADTRVLPVLRRYESELQGIIKKTNDKAAQFRYTNLLQGVKLAIKQERK